MGRVFITYTENSKTWSIFNASTCAAAFTAAEKHGFDISVEASTPDYRNSGKTAIEWARDSFATFPVSITSDSH